MIAEPQADLLHESLNPRRSVVVSACAGSGKTWLLVSRIVRLLLSGVAPSEILAITFTRHAAQEMAARLREWLELLASEDEPVVRSFMRERAVPDAEIDVAIERGRQLHEEVLCAQPSITISTFHSWYLQLLRSAPLSAGAIGQLTLTEQRSALVTEAWALFASACQRDPLSPAARGLDQLFAAHGLTQTRCLLASFLQHRAEWWSYAGTGSNAIERALGAQAAILGVSPDADVVGELFEDRRFIDEVREMRALLEKNTPSDMSRAQALDEAWRRKDTPLAFEVLRSVFFTVTGEPRKVRPGKTQAQRLGPQGQARFVELHASLGERIGATVAALCDQASLRSNAAGLAAGVALLAAYQTLKRDRQIADFADIEWLAFDLLSRSEQAVTMQFKLDNRYRHILLDEFQDTNPLQWLALKSWFEAAAQADSHPVVFLVGDPKQAIYRFRRAEARLFDSARQWLVERQNAIVLSQDESRRCSQAVLDIVNRLFDAQPEYADYRDHRAHYRDLPGRVEVWPLSDAGEAAAAKEQEAGLRDPLTLPRRQPEDLRRDKEAYCLVERLREIVGRWEIVVDSGSGRRRLATFADVMILVQRRTHLQAYERILRHAGVPFSTSRQGGLLGTLEASDMMALLGFLVSPYEDLKLAQTLRSPIFGCSDDDLLTVSGASGESWWHRLRGLPIPSDAIPLLRARSLLSVWLERADRLPVHDQLDKIYFEADIERRYVESVTSAMRGTVVANLRAFLERALAVDSGRYPSLPRFIDELSDLSQAPLEEAPDEGKLAAAGDAVRILTVHGAKGLEAPIVWLLDAASPRLANRGYEVMVDWPPGADAPANFSLRTRTDELSRIQRAQLELERRHDDREDLNLLYVAMTRAKQVLIVSGCEGPGVGGSWYQRIRSAVESALGTVPEPGMALAYGNDLRSSSPHSLSTDEADDGTHDLDGSDLPQILPTGMRHERSESAGQLYGAVFHRVLELVTAQPAVKPADVAMRLGLPEHEARRHVEHAHRLVGMPKLRRFFDPGQYRRAFNELPLVLADGKMRRLDRVVEFADEAWVLDYKTGSHEPSQGSTLATQYVRQVAEYCAALRHVFSDKPVFGALVFSDGDFIEVAE